MVMKKETASRTKKIDWAAEVRKYKPQLNALSDVERQQLLVEAVADIGIFLK